MEEDFNQAHDASVFELYSCDFGVALDEGFGQTSQQVELAVDIEVLGLDLDPAVGDLLEAHAQGVPVRESLFEAEVFEIIANQFEAKEGRCFFVSLQEGVAAPSPQNVMAMLDAFDDCL